LTDEEPIYRAYDAWSRRDIEGLLAVVHPDAEARPILGANIGTSVYAGHDGLRDWVLDLHRSGRASGPASRGSSTAAPGRCARSRSVRAGARAASSSKASCTTYSSCATA
jgi:ketosteroid isomerase-like protein